ncbi:hypothetical protein EIN_108590 [Entamoeba invadens IP1]|uniref:Uncharacterized protein n=1 Tax=Entamoeba invadens IP1 TaxID=370355 RepID=L7FNY7_ENTIV|nr:hypothetical protein EIN_108590 [Entamoeba invadens IP1]ELP94697.1 hypothetical protein EIN_108590 [Entamoeba invadens IP1]|eukprot:XP_004261468.1 hypothetical protein EIN_108590 [Entamoeba invadens IP1]
MIINTCPVKTLTDLKTSIDLDDLQTQIQNEYGTKIMIYLINLSDIKSLEYAQTAFKMIKETNTRGVIVCYQLYGENNIFDQVQQFQKDSNSKLNVLIKGMEEYNAVLLNIKDLFVEITIPNYRECPCRKPIILLYDENGTKGVKTKTTATLTLNTHKIEIGETFPQIKEFQNQENKNEKRYKWELEYSSNGRLACDIFLCDRKYSYLFWEGRINQYFEGTDIEVGSIENLCVLLKRLGLNEYEINDFVVYWMGEMKCFKSIGVRIVGEEYEKEVKLAVDGFSAMRRVFIGMFEADGIHLKGIESVKQIERPIGKYIIEWGAFIIH